jgi:multicomponent Na+:H+ antiporter subunit E
MLRRAAALFVWAAIVWLLLTWTVTAEQLVFGGLLAAAVAATQAPLGAVARPWRVLDPRRLWPTLQLIAVALIKIAIANAELAWRIWSPSRPLASGMVIVPTRLRSDGALGGLGLITSLIVDNQITDLDRKRDELQYHAVAVPEGDPQAKARAITHPVEGLLERITRRR